MRHMSRVHYVRWGETLATIARTYYDDPQLAGEIYKANRSIISDPNMLYPGLPLTIPYLDEDVIPVMIES